MTSPGNDLLATLEGCTLCPRLVVHREAVSLAPPRRHAGKPYWARPVPGFGDPKAPIWLVGLAPSAQGANRTGRMFTGDASAAFLASALFSAGLASSPVSEAQDDGFVLKGAFITAALRCVPPDNRPTSEEIQTCTRYLDAEWRLGVPGRKSVVALGTIALDSVARLLDRQHIAHPRMQFSHGAKWEAERDVAVFASYHPSPQNTNTGRLTPAMILAVLESALSHISEGW